MSQEIITANVGGSYAMPPAGNQIATCVGLYIIGTVEETFEGHKKKVKKLMLAFELVDTNHVFKEEKGPEPFIMHKEFTHGLSSKSNLRKFLDSWAGKKLTDETAKTFNLANLVGGSCLANVVHDKNKKGDDVAVLISASPVPNGMAITKSRLPHRIFNINKQPFDSEGFSALPEWIQKKIKTADEYQPQASDAVVTPQGDNPFAQVPVGTVTQEQAKKLF